MPSIGEPGTPAPFHEEREESTGEARQRLASWFISFWRIFGVKFDERHREAAAVLSNPFIKRWPILGKWKAPKK